MSDIELGMILKRDQLGAWAAKIHALGKTIAFTNGCFDLVHSGHLASLTQAAEVADHLVVALNSDPSVHQLKGPGRPILPEAERAALIAALPSSSSFLRSRRSTRSSAGNSPSA